MRFESLIFDIDGTIWDSRALVAEGYNLQLRDEGLAQYFVDAQRLRPLFGMVKDAIADELFPGLPPRERYALIERCMEREHQHLLKNECRIGYQGIEETMERLSGHHRLFIVSNSCAWKSWVWAAGSPAICASVTPAPPRGKPSGP